MLVSASILSETLKPEVLIKKFNDTKVDYIHLDVMDGKFVTNKTFLLSEIKKFNDLSTKKLDVHLMVSNPKKYIEALALMNTLYITFHYEAVKNISELIELVKSYGIKVGISINPKTDVTSIFPYLKDIDMVLVMSVNPGKSGQTFIEGVKYKIEALNNEIKNNDYKTIISVDGGVNKENSLTIKQLGANMLVTASFIQGDDMIQNINYLKEL